MTTSLKKLPIPIDKIQITQFSSVRLSLFSGPFTSNQTVTLAATEALIVIQNRPLFNEVIIYHNRSATNQNVSISVISTNPMWYYKTIAKAGVNNDLVITSTVAYGSIECRASCLQENDPDGTMNAQYLRMRLYPAMFSLVFS